MKLICPSCQKRIKIGEASRYDIFTCDDCGRQFRGIYADHAPLDFVLKKYFTLASGYDAARQTPCPYCWASISLGFRWEEGVNAPDYCWSCGKNLPTSEIKTRIRK